MEKETLERERERRLTGPRQNDGEKKKTVMGSRTEGQGKTG